MCIDVKGHRDVHANNNSPLVHLAHHEEDLKQTKWLQATRRNRTRDETHHLELVHKRCIRQKLERLPHKVRSRRQQVALKVVRGSAYMDFSLPGSPLLGQDEKHTKEREHACIFQQVHHTQQLLKFSHRDTVRNKISNRGPVSARVYPQEVQRSSRTIQKKGELHHKINAFHLGFTTYEVIEQVSNSTFNKFFVTYDAVSRERVDNMAPKYILENWSKNIKRRYTHIKSSQDEPLLEPRSKRFDDLVFRSHNICEFASESEELIGILHRKFDNVMAKMQEYQERSKGKNLLSHEEATGTTFKACHVSEQEAGPRTDWDQTWKKRSQTPRRKRKSHLQAS
ncbi:Transposon protein [Arachis hypogaea]|nr:Transposon protein [Arachis hypogaea]